MGRRESQEKRDKRYEKAKIRIADKVVKRALSARGLNDEQHQPSGSSGASATRNSTQYELAFATSWLVRTAGPTSASSTVIAAGAVEPIVTNKPEQHNVDHINKTTNT